MSLSDENLIQIEQLIEDGSITPIIGSTYTFEKIVVAHRLAETKHERGNMIITVKD